MTIINRYIFQRLILSMLGIVAVCVGVVWLFLSVRYMDMIIKNSLELMDYFLLIISMLPDLLVAILPLCIVLAILVVYQQLHFNQEMLALKSLGLSPRRLIAPIIALGVLVSGLMFITNIYIVPKAWKTLQDREHEISKKFSTNLIYEGQFNSIQGTIIYVQKRLPNKQFRGVFIYQPRNSQGEHPPRTIIAQSGYLDKNVLNLKNGIYHTSENRMKVTRLHFQEFTVELDSFVSKKPQRVIKPYEYSLKQLLNAHQLAALDSKTQQRMYAEGHQRIILPIVALINCLIAAFFMLNPAHSRKKRRILVWSTLTTTISLHATVLILINLYTTIHFAYIVLVSLLLGVIFWLRIWLPKGVPFRKVRNSK